MEEEQQHLITVQHIYIKGCIAIRENTATNIEETLKKLVGDLNETPREVLDALKNQTVDLVPTAHPTQSIRRSLLQKHGRIMEGFGIVNTYFLRRVDTTLKNIGINEHVPYSTPLIQFCSWMGSDRDGNPRVTPEVTRDVCLLARMMAANLYYSQIEDLMFELPMWRCNDELRDRATDEDQ